MNFTELKTPLLKEEELDQNQIAVSILEKDHLSPDVTKFKTMKQAVDGASFDKIYCFETRHGELWSTALEGLLVPLLGQVLALRSMYRLLARRFIVYLYKFKKDGGEFFITFKKRDDKFSKKPTPKIEDFDITLSQIPSSKNGDEYVAVPLKYEYDHASGVITYPYFVNVASSRGDGRALITTEVYSTIRPHERSNMIITEDMTQQLTDMEVSIMSAVEAIKKVNYSQCLDRQKKFSDYLFNIRKKQPHRDFDEIAQEFDKAYYNLDESVKFDRLIGSGGSAKKNKYTSRIISRKRRLSGKKGRKYRKSYKKVKSRKMARR